MNGISDIDLFDINISDNSSSIILNEEKLFNDVAFKVLKNQEKYGLIKCGKLSQNGKIKIVYDSSKYKSFSAISNQLNSKEFLTVVSNIHDVINRVSENGFIKLENILLSGNTIFVDINDLSVHMICVPLSGVSLFENKEIAKMELEKLLCKEKNKIPGVSIEDLKKILNEGNYSPINESEEKNEEPVEKEFVGSEQIQNDIPKKEIKKKGNAAVVINIIVSVLLVLIGVAIWLLINMIIGISIVSLGIIYGIVSYIILYKSKKNKKRKKQKITLVSQNLKPKLNFCVDKPAFSIGRQYGSVDAVIENQNKISRLHCKITSKDGKYFIEDTV